MTKFFQLLQFIRDYDLGTVLRRVCFLPVLLYVLYAMTKDWLTAMELTLDWPPTPTALIHPLALVAADLGRMTCRELRTISRGRTKVDLISNALALI